MIQSLNFTDCFRPLWQCYPLASPQKLITYSYNFLNIQISILPLRISAIETFIRLWFHTVYVYVVNRYYKAYSSSSSSPYRSMVKLLKHKLFKYLRPVLTMTKIYVFTSSIQRSILTIMMMYLYLYFICHKFFFSYNNNLLNNDGPYNFLKLIYRIIWCTIPTLYMRR